MFTLTILEILLSEGRSVLSLTQRDKGSERVAEEFPHYYSTNKTYDLTKQFLLFYRVKCEPP